MMAVARSNFNNYYRYAMTIPQYYRYETKNDWQGEGFFHLLQQRVAQQADRPYASEFTSDGLRTFTFGDISARIDAVAAGFQARDIRKGDRVALMLDTHSDYLCAALALAKIGAVWVPVGTRLMPANLDYIFSEAEIRLIVAEAHLADTVIAAGHPSIPLITRQSGVGIEAALPAEAALQPVDVAAGDLVMLSFTSGTTGRPKSVPVTHAMLRFACEGAARAAKASPGEILYIWEPFHHIGGAQLTIMPLIREVSLALTPRFTASGFWDQVRACGATRIHYLGGILQMLLKQPPSPRDKDHKVDIAWGAGCTADIWAAFSVRFGCRIVECYGMTEGSSLTTVNDEDLPGYIGRALPWFDVSIRNADGSECLRGAKGEIVVAPIGKGSAAIFAGYLNSPEATHEALRDGRLHTGDLGEMDSQGRVRYHGRMKDTIRVRGENVSAWEVEHVVEQHDSVAACAVIPVKAEIGEAEIKLFVQPAPGAHLDGETLFNWLSQRLARHQLPKYIALVPGFERTPSLRIMKHKLDSTPSGEWTRP